MSSGWIPPDDLDTDVLGICQAMNACPGILTTSSCSGHGKRPFRIWFVAETLDALPPLLYWTAHCHTGQAGWSVTAGTDCAADGVMFMLEGPPGAYEAAAVIARYMQEGAGS